MKKICSLIAFLSIAFCTTAQNDPAKLVLAILDEQVAAWNTRDLDAFMKGYWNNDLLMYIGASGVTYGYQQALEKYKRAYPSAEAMGYLSFDNLQAQKLSDEYYFVVGKYLLKRSVGNKSGQFSLLVRNFNGRWLIVADHSS